MPPSASARPTSTWLARKATTHTANIRPATAAAIMPMSMASQGLSTPHESTAITEVHRADADESLLGPG